MIIETKMLDNSGVDFIAGPDAYRDLPRLVANAKSKLATGGEGSKGSMQRFANVQLSLEETYADM